VGAFRISIFAGGLVNGPARRLNKICVGGECKAPLYFVSATGLSILYAAGILGIPERTLARRKKENRLSSDESERLLRMAKLFDDSLSLFEGDREAAVNWLRAPKKALRNQSPFHFARTEIGAREVENLIGRIEHGVFS
jgi:putative toxin-antitoxin system antitoxin component (TIGR02293 family)